MGWDILTFRGHVLMVNDLGCALALNLIAKLATPDPNSISDQKLREALDRWSDEKNYFYCTGVLDVKLEELNDCSDRTIDQLVRIIRDTKNTLQARFGETLPQRWLNETLYGCADSPFFANHETAKVLRTLDQIEDLLLGHEHGVPRPAAAPCTACGD